MNSRNLEQILGDNSWGWGRNCQKGMRGMKKESVGFTDGKIRDVMSRFLTRMHGRVTTA